MKNDLHRVFISELKDIYDAEHRIKESLPKFAQAARADEVRKCFEEHQKETNAQIQRLETIFEAFDETPERNTCKGAKGLMEEGEQLLAENRDKDALDAVLIAAAQKVEHYEIASYGTLCTWAKELSKEMGHDAVLDELKKSLAEEKAADEKLTAAATQVANQEAMHTR